MAFTALRRAVERFRPDVVVSMVSNTDEDWSFGHGRALLHAARQEALRILEEDPELSSPDFAQLRAKMEAFWDTAAGAS